MKKKKKKKHKDKMRLEFTKLWIKKSIHKNKKKYSRKTKSNTSVETDLGTIRLL
jgi:hypothetical protein